MACEMGGICCDESMSAWSDDSAGSMAAPIVRMVAVKGVRSEVWEVGCWGSSLRSKRSFAQQ